MTCMYLALHIHYRPLLVTWIYYKAMLNKMYSLFDATLYCCHTQLLLGGVVQWLARLTRDRRIPVSREFEPHQRPP